MHYLITPPFYTWQSHSSQFLSSKGVLAIPLIIFIAGFWNPFYFWYIFLMQWPEVNIVSGSIPYVNNSTVIFSVLFLFYSTDIQISNVLFNHCCACQEKVFIELSTTILRYFPWVVTVHYIRQPGAWLLLFPRCSTLYLSTITSFAPLFICQPAFFYSLSSFVFSNLDSCI